MFLILTNKDTFQKYFSKEVIEKLSIKNTYMNKTTRNILLFISLILMIIALARPVANEKVQSFKQEVASIVVAIDVSKSMLATDLYPNRLVFAKQKLLNLIDLSKKNAIAVILFAKSSFILSPVTQDFNSLKILVENLNPGINFDNGSNIFSTLETTNKLLKGYENKNLIILTDGGNNDSYEKEIEYANENKINIYTIATATNKAAPIKLENGDFMTKKDGNIVTVSLNENIKNLSLNTNGGYIQYSNSNEDIEQILKDIDAKSSKKELESKKFKTYTELFYYPLAASIFLLLIAFSSLPSLKRKSTQLILLGVLFIFSTNNLKALEFDFENIEKADEYYNEGKYKEASLEYKKIAKTPEANYNLANSYYKNKEYKKAQDAYKNVVSSNKDLEFRKLHNLGNTYVKLQDLQNAKKMYENALKIKEDKQTRENLEIVEKLLKNKDNKQQNKDNKQQNNQDKDKDKKQKNKENNQDKNKEQENKQKQDKQQQDKEQEESKNQQKNKEEENSENKKNNQQNKDNQNEKQEIKNQEIKENEISDLEEKKWLEQLQKDKTPVLLKRVKTKNEDNTSTPW